ncbi:4Fe-4S ferredoxin iron-sulfur binding domain-containing protein [Desulfovibrio sp. X2]|uniref:4Fe-4S binding protein n=1 Tax=Desulfovibrio sp. X2 TaxID=941449 RepID=UPI000358A3D1|nr:4Fe-4S binding protein [Desulfovibrio sp. X2]EPR43909.1 4Fe-4S ferredoxin iron-sulfur binding domain-containing protein [Desulfovibrio sp. X2]
MASAARTLQWKRRIIQAASLFVIGEFSYFGIFRCPFAVPYVSCPNCPVVQCPGRKLWLTAWIGILASALFFGRAFCGYACPGGMVAELFDRVSPFTRSIGRRVSKGFDRVLRNAKYVAAAAALYLFLGLHNPRWAVPIRTGEFFQATALTFHHAFTPWLFRTGTVLGALALGLLVPYFWCRYLCPTGGILDVFGRFAPARHRMTADCTDCGKCERSCGMATRPSEPNCTNCGACVSDCPANAIRFGLGGGGGTSADEENAPEKQA